MLNPYAAYLRIARIVGLIALVIGGAWYLHHRFELWRQSVYADGYNSGVNSTNLKWQTASTKAAQANLDAALADSRDSRTAVAGYLQSLQDLAPKLQGLGSQRITYVTSKAGTAPCLDPDGVQLIRMQRKALGLDAGADPATRPTGATAP